MTLEEQILSRHGIKAHDLAAGGILVTEGGASFVLYRDYDGGIHAARAPIPVTAPWGARTLMTAGLWDVLAEFAGFRYRANDASRVQIIEKLKETFD